MDKQYYKEYYRSEREHWFFRGRADIIMKHISQIVDNRQSEGELRILNVGVATGRTSELLAAFGKVKSVEFDEDCYNFTKENVEGIDLIQGSILELPFEADSFDLVCAFDVIEHVEDDQLAVNEMKRVCNSDGTVVITVPAFMSLWSNHDVVNHHFRRYKLNQINNLFDDTSKFVYRTYFNFWLFPLAYGFRKLNNLLKLGKKVNAESTGSDIALTKGNSFSSAILYRLFSSEKAFVTNRIRLPFGVSILASWKK